MEKGKQVWNLENSTNDLVILESNRIYKARYISTDSNEKVIDENDQQIEIRNSLPLSAIKKATLNENKEEITLQFGDKSSFWIDGYDLLILNEIFESICNNLNQSAPERRKLSFMEKGKKPMIAIFTLSVIYFAITITSLSPSYSTSFIGVVLKAFASLNLLTLNFIFITLLILAIISLIAKSKKKIYVRELEIR